VEPCDVLFVIGDGLSARAVASHALPLIAATLPLLHEQGLRVGPVVIASEARVALADEVGECLQAAMVVMLIGERPGLSSPDSLGCISPAHHAVGAWIPSATAFPMCARKACPTRWPPTSWPG
jgi:ethanolamine ammonia-lyase small subunit